MAFIPLRMPVSSTPERTVRSFRATSSRPRWARTGLDTPNAKATGHECAMGCGVEAIL